MADAKKKVYGGEVQFGEGENAVTVNFGKAGTMKCVIADDNSKVTEFFQHGVQKDFALADLPTDIQGFVAMAGIRTLLSDATASHPAPEDKLIAVDTKWASLLAGNTTAVKASGISNMHLTARAILRYQGGTENTENLEKVVAAMRDNGQEVVKAWQKTPGIKLAMAELQAEDLRAQLGDEAEGEAVPTIAL